MKGWCLAPNLTASCVHNHSNTSNRFDMLNFTENRSAIQWKNSAAILERIDICMLFFWQWLHRTDDVPVGVRKLAGRRPVTNQLIWSWAEEQRDLWRGVWGSAVPRWKCWNWHVQAKSASSLHQAKLTSHLPHPPWTRATDDSRTRRYQQAWSYCTWAPTKHRL